MKQHLLVLSMLVFVPFVTTSSFLDIYSSRTERLLGNPTANNEYMQWFSSYGQNTTMNMSITTPDVQGDGFMQASTRTDKKSNIAWSIHLAASGTADMLSGALEVSAEMVLSSWSLYIKPTLTTLPTEVFSAEEQVGFQLLDGKWLQINDETTFPGFNLPTTATDPVRINQQLSSLVTSTPVLKPTKELTRNGYEIYLVDIDPAGIENLVAGVINTMTTQAGLPAETAMSLPSRTNLEDMDIKTIGVIGRKGDEIKMGLIMKKMNDPHHVVLLSHATSTGTNLTFRMVEKRSKDTVFNFTMANDLSTLGTQDMQIEFVAAEDQIDLSAHLKTTVYDAGATEITAPTWAILLSELMQ